MKYEYLCGYESDFFTMPANVIAVVRLDHCVQGLTEFNQITECGKPVLAMRRIISDPKRWTMEDKKAGRLPEVGVEVQFNFYQSAVMRQGVIKYINDQVVVIQTEDVTRPFCYETCKVVFTPIETPEEKAQREESEFVSLVEFEYNKMPNEILFRAGIRAAYRKLKGGE